MLLAVPFTSEVLIEGFFCNYQNDMSSEVKMSNPHAIGGGTRSGIKMLFYQSDASNSCGGNNYVRLPETFLTNSGIDFDEMCSGVLNEAVLQDYDVVYLGRSRSRGQVVEADVRDWVQNGGGAWAESCGMVDQNDPVGGGWVAMEDMFGYTNRIGRGDNAGGFSFSKVGDHEIWDNVNSPVSGSNGLYDSELTDNNIAPAATRIGNAGNHQSPVVNFYGQGRTYSGVGGNWDSNGNCQQYFLNVVNWLGQGGVAHIDDIVVEGAGEDEICYARHKAYNVSVNITVKEALAEVSHLEVFLDYNTTNATLCYNWTNQEFLKLQDPDGHVELEVPSCEVSNDGVKMWWVNFSILFNFTFPHEGQVDCYGNITSVSGDYSEDRYPWLCRVENDLEFTGAIEATGEHQGPLSSGDWIRGSEGLNFTGLTVRYQGSPDIYPENEFFDVLVDDGLGNSWWNNMSSGSLAYFECTALNRTEENMDYSFTIENIPDSGYCSTNLTFPLKIDADAPSHPPDLKTLAYGKVSDYTKDPSVNFTWDQVTDNASGLLGYYYSKSNGSGGRNGSFTLETEGELGGLHEGWNPVYVWCEDRVGNIGHASGTGILVDLTGPVFSNFTPSGGIWQNATTLDCSVEIRDPNGTGVDGNSIFYSISTSGPNSFSPWVPLWVPQSSMSMVVSAKCKFEEGLDNYIKWKARDVAENQFVESIPQNIRIDASPLVFSEDFSPDQAWFAERSVELTTSVKDGGSSGVDLDSLEVRFSVSGKTHFSPWEPVLSGNITPSEEGWYDIKASHDFLEGTDNFIQFRGTDGARNPYSLSDMFQISIDSSPVEYGDFTIEDIEDAPEVECSMEIFDLHSGVDLDSIEYSISIEGDDNRSFGDWSQPSPSDIITGTPVRVYVKEEYDWGRDNYIRFRASDMVGWFGGISPSFRINVTSEPKAVISNPPDKRQEFPHGTEVNFNASGSFDLDGDPLTYYWVSNNSGALSGNISFSMILPVGNHTITLYVEDADGNNISADVLADIKGKKGGGSTGDDDDDSGGGVLDASSDGGICWLWILIIIVVLLLILLLLFIVVRRRKKEEKAEPHPEPAPFAPGPQPPRGPSPPYGGGPSLNQYPVQMQLQAPIQPPQGAHFPPPAGEGRHQLPPPPAFSGGPEVSLPALPPAPQGQKPPGPPEPELEYALPSFDTGSGVQDLNKKALPPAPPDIPAARNDTPSPSAQGSSMTLECHVCRAQYSTLIESYPAVVTCPECGSQGQLEGP